MAWFGLKKLGKAVPDTTLDDDPNKQHHLPFSVVIENGDLEGVKIALENELDRGKDARDVVNARTGVVRTKKRNPHARRQYKTRMRLFWWCVVH